MIRSVLVESKQYTGSYGSSGIMYNNSYVITTFNVISPFFSNSDVGEFDYAKYRFLKSTFNTLKDILFLIYAKDEDSSIISSYTARFESLFVSSNIKVSIEFIFRNWTFDSSKSNIDSLSYFVIFKIDCARGNALKEDLHYTLNKMPKTSFSKGQNLNSVSSAFGNRQFMNHYSQGIVSNILGKNNCLIFSDMPLTPGSEGSPVYIDDGSSSRVPVGIVISSMNWWKGEPLNFSVIADLRSLFSEILQQNLMYKPNQKGLDTNIALLNAIESGLFQIYNGSIWGTAIVIDREKGILLTNAHVVEHSSKHLTLHQRDRSIPCEIIFSCPADHPIDIAVLKATEPLEKHCRSISFSDGVVACGDTVYGAGFPIFPKESNSGVTVTKGYVSHVHPHMIKTTCSIHPGASGGAILDETGKLVAIIVCNAKTSDPINMIYSRVNMNIPAKLLQPILRDYIANEDETVLQKLSAIDARIWNFSSKL